MYRVVLYYVLFLWLVAVIYGYFGILPYRPIFLTLSLIFITTVCWCTNTLFRRIFEAPVNIESVYITAAILVLIVAPPRSIHDFAYYSLAGWASVWAMASKFMFTIKRKHIFNPAAFGVAVTALTIHQSASWWIGTLALAPYVVIGGLLMVRKLIRADLVWSFIIVALISIIGTHLTSSTNIVTDATRGLFYTPLLFFAFIMLTEPLTTPPKKSLRIGYGSLVGVLFSPSIHLGTIYSTPELALLVGNVFSYLVSPKTKLMLMLEKKIRRSPDIFDFVFRPDRTIRFKPGQYLEWTLPHSRPDSRGNRRYFTIASSPTETSLIMGVKFYEPSSSFKKNLLDMNVGDGIVASQLAGEFVMPKDKNQKLVFMAGGIGITPFRSMIKYLMDRRERRDIILLYSNVSSDEIVYKDLFDAAETRVGIKTVYAITDGQNIPATMKAYPMRFNANIIMKEVPDFRERKFYLSGSHGMVVAFDKTLRDLGLAKNRIKKDFFPGFV